MINTIEGLIKSCEVLNDSLGKKLISKKVLAKVYVDIDKFKQLKQEVIDRLDRINCLKFDKGNVGDLNMSLIYLHLEVSRVECHFDQIRYLIEKIIGRYRKLVREQGYAKD